MTSSSEDLWTLSAGPLGEAGAGTWAPGPVGFKHEETQSLQ